MRTFLVLLLAALLFGTWAVLDEPTKQERALAEDAELQAVSLEFYEANAVRGKARFFARETVER